MGVISLATPRPPPIDAHTLDARQKCRLRCQTLARQWRHAEGSWHRRTAGDVVSEHSSFLALSLHWRHGN